MSATRNSHAVATGRPFTARSVIASTLLGTHPPQLDTRRLLRSGALFQIPEGTVRVALSRMVAAGELTLDDGRYRLAGHLLARQGRQDQSRQGLAPDAPWNGAWEMAVVDAEARAASDRAALRDAMGRLRLAELREGMWMRPANLPPERFAPERATVAPWCRWFRGAPADDASSLALRLWDLSGWAEAARGLLRDLDAFDGPFTSGDLAALPAAFTANAAVLRHLQADPLLPGPLLPRRWPGEALRTSFEVFDQRFTTLWRRWLRDG